jgi:hypothetical protein
MPVKPGHDSHGKFYRWGSGKKYYYKTKRGAMLAKRKAAKQGRAIKAH